MNNYLSIYFESIMIFFSPGLNLTFTFTDEDSSNGNDVSSTRSLGRYTKYFPSFLLNMLPMPWLAILNHFDSMNKTSVYINSNDYSILLKDHNEILDPLIDIWVYDASIESEKEEFINGRCSDNSWIRYYGHRRPV